MKRSQFKSRMKILVPNMQVEDQELYDLLNDGVDQANFRVKAYRGYTDIDAVADQSLYSLSSVAPTYLGPEKKRLYMKNSAGNWQYITPKTKDWVEKLYPDFLNAASATLPQWNWFEGDELGLYPPPSTAYAAGIRIYHLKKSVPMTNDNHYPFTGSATEVVALKPMDDAIIAYARWKLSPAVGAVTDQDIRQREFLSECSKAAKQIKRRPDVTGNQAYGIKIW